MSHTSSLLFFLFFLFSSSSFFILVDSQPNWQLLNLNSPGPSGRVFSASSQNAPGKFLLASAFCSCSPPPSCASSPSRLHLLTFFLHPLLPVLVVVSVPPPYAPSDRTGIAIFGGTSNSTSYQPSYNDLWVLNAQVTFFFLLVLVLPLPPPSTSFLHLDHIHIGHNIRRKSVDERSSGSFFQTSRSQEFGCNCNRQHWHSLPFWRLRWN
jgi:hypothetical protein